MVQLWIRAVVHFFSEQQSYNFLKENYSNYWFHFILLILLCTINVQRTSKRYYNYSIHWTLVQNGCWYNTFSRDMLNLKVLYPDFNFVPNWQSSLVRVMVWRPTGNKPLHEPIKTRLMGVTIRPQASVSLGHQYQAWITSFFYRTLFWTVQVISLKYQSIRMYRKPNNCFLT